MFLIGGVALYVTVTKIQLQTGLWSGLEFWVKAVKYLTEKKKKKKGSFMGYHILPHFTTPPYLKHFIIFLKSKLF